MFRSIYRSGQGELLLDLPAEQIRAALQDKEGTLWVDLTSQEEEAGSLLREVFEFHPLAIGDALHQTHIPRVDDWQDHLYIVIHALHLELNRTLDTHELDVFVGRNYLVTIHEEPIRALDQLWDRCRGGAERRLKSGPDHLLYQLTDGIVADYMPVVDGLDDEIDELEDEIFGRPSPRTVSRIFRARRTLLRLRRILASLREVLNRLARDDYAVIDAEDRVYFRDVYDHLVRLYDIVEGLRDMVATALDSYLSVTSNRLNEIMRTLTVVTVLFMPMSFLAGFFGMNFFGDEFMVHDPFPRALLFWGTMALMFATPAVMLWWMHRKGWLRSVSRQRPAPEKEENEEPGDE